MRKQIENGIEAENKANYDIFYEILYLHEPERNREYRFRMLIIHYVQQPENLI